MTKNLSRRRFLASTAATGVVALATPHIANAQAKQLNITGWGGKWGEVFEATVGPAFEREFDCTIVRDTSFPFTPKLQASSRSNPIYDVMHANMNAQVAAANMGLVEPKPDASQIPNLADLYPYAVSDIGVGVTMFTSAIGMGYRRDLVEASPTSWEDIFSASYEGSRGAYVIPINSLGMSFFMMMGQVFGEGLKDTDAAFAAMERLKPVKLVDFTGSMEQMLLSGEVRLGVIHDSGILRHFDQDTELAFASPREGVMALEQVLTVTPGSDKKDLANAFINFMLEPANQKLLAEAVWYSPANTKVTLDERFNERLLTTPEKVATLVQMDWAWYNANKDMIDSRVNRIFRA
jgi:putative spermidine/putrescine transport system substrate-binding protein